VTSTDSLVLQALTASLSPGRRGPELAVAGALAVPCPGSVEELSLFLALHDDDGHVLLVEEERLEAERTVMGRLLFQTELRLSRELCAAVAHVELWAVALVEECLVQASLPAAALADPGPGGRSVWRGPALSLVREPVQQDGDVRLHVYGRCPLEPGAIYARSGEVQLTALGAGGAVLFHDRTSFPTHGGQLGAALISERLRPHVAELEGAEGFALAVIVQRHLTTGSVVIDREDLYESVADD
jgi:hypothetical protein